MSTPSLEQISRAAVDSGYFEHDEVRRAIARHDAEVRAATSNVTHERIVARLRAEAIGDPHTGWLSDAAHSHSLAWDEANQSIEIFNGSIDIGHLASVVAALIEEARRG